MTTCLNSPTSLGFTNPLSCFYSARTSTSTCLVPLPSQCRIVAGKHVRRPRRQVDSRFLPFTSSYQRVTPSAEQNGNSPSTVAADVDSNARETSELLRGALTMVLHVKFKTHVCIADGHVLLSEYARHTIREPGVLRCDVLYDVTKRGVPKGPYYQIWTTFFDSKAYMQHERTSHATKLRVYIDGGSTKLDTATLLTKLAHRVSVLRPLFPAVGAWQSSLHHSEDDDFEDERDALEKKSHRIRRGTPNMGEALEKSFPPRPPSPSSSPSSSSTPSSKKSPASDELEKKKRILNELFDISRSPDAKTVKIQLCEALAKSSDDMRHVREKCERHLEKCEKSAGVVRTALLVDRSNPLRVLLMSVHDPDDFGDGVYFDTQLAEEHLVENPRNTFSLPWTVSRLAAVFPDLIGWEKYVGHEKAVEMGFEAPSLSKPSFSFLNQPATDSKRRKALTPEEQVLPGQLQRREQGDMSKGKSRKPPNAPGYRLVYGYSAFDKAKELIREMAGVPTGECRILMLPGWNQSRLETLTSQLEYDPRSDPGPIVYAVANSVQHGAVTVEKLRSTLKLISKFGPHLLVAFGGSSVMDYGKLLSQFARACDIPSALSEFEAQLAANETGHLKLPGHPNPFPLLVMPIALGPGTELTDLAVVRHPLDVNTFLDYKSIYVTFDYEHHPHVAHATHKTVLIDSRICAPKRLMRRDAGRAALCNTCVAIDTFFSSHRESQNEMDANVMALSAAQLYAANFTRALREPRESSGEARDVMTKAGVSLGMAMDSVGKPGIAVRLTNAVIDVTFYERPDYAFRYILTRVGIAYIDIVLQRMPLDRVKLDEVFHLNPEQQKKGVVDNLLRMADESNIPLLRTLGLPRRKVTGVARVVERQLLDLDLDACSDVELIFRKSPKLLDLVLHSALDQSFEL